MNEALNLNKTNEEEIIDVEIKEDVKSSGNIFLSSLESLSEEDIILNEVAKNVKKPQIDYVRYFILLVLVSIFVYSGYTIVAQLFGYAEAARDNNMLQERFHSGYDLPEDIPNLQKARAGRPIQDILSLQKQTAVPEIASITSEGMSEASKKIARLQRFSDIKDLYGWIRISDTNIDLPVVQANDNDYYLKRNVYGKTQSSGSIYVDEQNDKNPYNNLNTIIYGHNMANGTVFSNLMNFEKYKWMFDNGFIELITPYGVFTYEIFSAHVVNEWFYYRETTFSAKNGLTAEEEYVRWLYEMKDLSKNFQKPGIEFTPESKIITLSTCTNRELQGNPRFAIHGILIDVQR